MAAVRRNRPLAHARQNVVSRIGVAVGVGVEIRNGVAVEALPVFVGVAETRAANVGVATGVSVSGQLCCETVDYLRQHRQSAVR